MRLLPKNEIDKKRAEENRQRMEEGLQIAERVDTLRETLASEEVAFDKYRTDRLRDIQGEINQKLVEYNNLEEHIKRDNFKEKDAQALFDIQWNKVSQKEREILEKIDAVEKKEFSLGQMASHIEKQKNELDEKENYLQLQLHKVNLNLEKTRLATEQKEKELKTVQMDKQRIEDDLSKRQIILNGLERDLVSKQDYIMNLLKKKEEDLDNREQIILTRELISASPVKK